MEDNSNPATTEDVNTLCHVLDRFGLSVIDKETENQLFSPLCALLAIGPLVYFDNYPRARLFEWLGLDPAMSDDVFANALASLGRGFEAGERNCMYWAVAYPRGVAMPVDVTYLRDRVGVRLVETTFPDPGTAILNQAVSETTHGRISEVVSGATERALFLVNAIYLRRGWQKHLGEVAESRWLLPDSCYRWEFSGAEGMFKYAETETHIYVAIPYRDPGCEMEIYLTRDRAKLPIGLTVDDMESLRNEAKSVKMVLFIPLWEDEAVLDVTEMLLVKAGISYQPPTHDRMNIRQKVNIDVDEWGTEAAAATCVDCPDSCPLPKRWPNPFIVNRPFVYTVRTGSVTEFMGYFYKPKDCCVPCDTTQLGDTIESDGYDSAGE